MTGRHNGDRRSEKALTQRRQAAVYQGAFEAVFSILIGAGFGYAADEWLETEPWLLLLGLVIGFAAFVLRLVQIGRRLQNPRPERPDETPGSEGS